MGGEQWKSRCWSQFRIFIFILDVTCRYTAVMEMFQGRFVKDCDKDIIQHLKLPSCTVCKHSVIMFLKGCGETGSNQLDCALLSILLAIRYTADLQGLRIKCECPSEFIFRLYRTGSSMLSKFTFDYYTNALFHINLCSYFI